MGHCKKHHKSCQKDKWFVVIHENADYLKTLSVSDYTDFASKGTLFTNYHALTHPSQPNYIGMIAGDTFENELDYGNEIVDFPNPDAPNANSTIIDLIENKGLSWKVYIENYPEGGTTDDFSFFVYTFGLYAIMGVESGPANGFYSAQQAIYGPQTPLPSTTLIETSNLDGTPGPGQDFTGKIVVVSRGGFPFTTKTKNAQNAGAIGVIIYNSKTGAGSMGVPGGVFSPGAAAADPSITIPTYGISRADGLFIVNGITTDPTSTGFVDNDPANSPSQAMYARKHNPFVSFLNISTNPQRMAHLVNAKEFSKDVACNKVPDFAFYIPNQNNDSHDTYMTQLTYNSPVEQYVPTYAGQMFPITFNMALKNKEFTKDRVFVLTFDESESEEGNNQVYCAFYGENVKRGEVVTTEYNHYNLLRTIEDSLKIGTLGRYDSTSAPMTGWRKDNYLCCHNINTNLVNNVMNNNMKPNAVKTHQLTTQNANYKFKLEIE